MKGFPQCFQLFAAQTASGTEFAVKRINRDGVLRMNAFGRE
jgi:hypothetical protein